MGQLIEQAVVSDPAGLTDALAAHERQAEWLRQVRAADVRRRLADGEKQADIARLYGFSHMTASRVARRDAGGAEGV